MTSVSARASSDSNPSTARFALLALFITHGILFGIWATQIPLAKLRLDVSLTVFGLALLCVAVGAVIAMPIAGALVNLFGSARMTWVTGALFSVFVAGPALAPNLPLFMIAAVLLGAAIGSMDVGMNAHGLLVERALRKPVMSGFHGGFSIGAAIGTILGAWVLGKVGTHLQLALFCSACLAAVLIAARLLLPSALDRGLSGQHFAWPTRTTIGLGLLCFLALMIEGSVADWGALMLSERFTVDAALAAMAFGFYQTGMAVARFTGDRLRAAFGAVRLVAVSATLTALGTAAALLVPGVYASLAAFAIAGLGIGNVAPVLFAGGGRLEPDAPGRGIAAVTTLGYSGFLAGPPLIGIVADITTLRGALFITVAAALIIAACARMVKAADTY